MSITYEDLYHLNLSTLNSAAEAWSGTSSKMKSIERDYSNDVQKPFSAAGWKSSDSTSQTAGRSCKDIGVELNDGQRVAQALHRSIADAREELKKHQKALRDLAENEAPRQNLRVSPTGTVSVSDDHVAGEDAQAQQARVDAFAKRISRVLDEAAATDGQCANELVRIIGSASSGFDLPAGIGPTGVQLASAVNGKGPMNLAPGPMPTIKDGTAPHHVREVMGILSYRPYIEGSKLMLKGKFSDGLSYAWEGVPPTAVGYGAGKAEKFSPGRHRKPSFVNKVGKAGARVLGLPVGIAATAVDYSTNMTGKEKFFGW
ncbi:hypothetical protein [Streptomyces abyssalis]|uniref:hypothetical protein n=1 Tax=Streptomyces abyssalis TaxID=933944 RepID=UPI001112F90F|nr:hypothetical protein [Streptomyces abyssalis]